MSSYQIGCGETIITAHKRGNLDSILAEIPYATVKWGRELDAVSGLSVTSDPGALACCSGSQLSVLGGLLPYANELAVYRDGVLAWSGPLYSREVGTGSFTLEAFDVGHIFETRLLRSNISDAAADLVTTFGLAIADALAVGNENGIVPVRQAGAVVTGRRGYQANAHHIVAEILDDLARTSVDWTAVNREIRYRATEITTPSIATLIADHWTEAPNVKISGDQLATRWVVTGSGGGPDGDDPETTGDVSTSSVLTGPIERVIDENSIKDFTSAAAAAQSRLDRTNPNQSANRLGYIEGGQLSQDAPVSLDPSSPVALIPGAIVTMSFDVLCVPVLGDYRLKGVDVSISPGVGETVEIRLTPVGSVG